MWTAFLGNKARDAPYITFEIAYLPYLPVMRDKHPGSRDKHPGSDLFPSPIDFFPSRIRIKNLSILPQKIVSKLSEI
jgi:hypothetical protein